MATQLELPIGERHQKDVIRDLSDYGKTRAPQADQPHMSDRARRNAAAARLRAAALPDSAERAKLTPEQIVDRRTSLADAQIALSVAHGVALDDIDPFSGYSMSRRACDAARRSWLSFIKFQGFSEDYDRQPLDKTLAWWVERRPQYLAGDDWLAAGMAAHREYWQRPGFACNRPTCDEHGEKEQ